MDSKEKLIELQMRSECERDTNGMISYELYMILREVIDEIISTEYFRMQSNIQLEILNRIDYDTTYRRYGDYVINGERMDIETYIRTIHNIVDGYCKPQGM